MAGPAERARTLYDYVERSQRVDLTGTIHPPEADSGRTEELDGPAVVVAARVGANERSEWFEATQPALLRGVSVRAPRTTADLPALLREARVDARLAHPNVLPIYRLDADRRLVYRRWSGITWSELLHGAEVLGPLAQGRDAISFHLDVWAEVARTLSWAHRRGIAHENVRTDHVRVGEHGEVLLGGWHQARALEPGDDDLPRAAEGRGRQHDLRGLAQLLEALCDTLQPLGVEALREVAGRVGAREIRDIEGLAAAVQRWRARRGGHRLRVQADARAQALREHLAQTEQDPAQVDLLASEARFAYREALAIWPGDTRAREGLEALLRRLVEYHCDRGQPRPAWALLGDLPDEPQLAERVRRVEEAQLVEQAEIGALTRYATSLSGRRGAFLRASSGVVMALGAWALCMALGIIDARWAVGYSVAIYGLAAFTVLSLCLAVMVNGMARSRANVRQITTGAATLGCAGAGWLICDWTGVPIEQALSLHALVVAGALGAGAWTVDSALALAPLIYLGTAVTIGAELPHPWLQFGLGNALALLSYAALSAVHALRSW